ncbi:hypothetical protein J6590_036718 [Homalodisca vitripennis]|nr:hypothetical protein J6590_036718 [Homalodisca vitripennis]
MNKIRLQLFFPCRNPSSPRKQEWMQWPDGHYRQGDLQPEPGAVARCAAPRQPARPKPMTEPKVSLSHSQDSSEDAVQDKEAGWRQQRQSGEQEDEVIMSKLSSH